MSANNRTPTTRLFALAALLLAASVFGLRAMDLFGGPAPEPAGDYTERELTYLLEPITGAEKIRVSVTGLTDRTILIMVDGDIATDMRPLRAQIENVLIASIGYDPEVDTLTLTQFPFARGVGASLTSLQIAELTALALLCVLLMVSMINRGAVRREDYARIDPQPAPRQLPQAPAVTMTEPAMDSDLRAASDLAESNPNETARLVRGWMSYAEE